MLVPAARDSLGQGRDIVDAFHKGEGGNVSGVAAWRGEASDLA
jgi:hypothetical protein